MKKTLKSSGLSRTVSATRRSRIDTSDIPEVRDFSKAVRGRFYRADSIQQLPIYLDKDVEKFVTKRAKDKKIQTTALVNDLLRKGISFVEAAE